MCEFLQRIAELARVPPNKTQTVPFRLADIEEPPEDEDFLESGNCKCNEGIFFEAATNKICDDLGHALKPRSLVIIADFKARGGFSSIVTAEYKAPAKKARR